MIELTNGRITSALLKKFASSGLSRFIIPSFVKVYNINLLEMEKPLGKYPTLHDFFIRKLKFGARKHDKSPFSIISPVDGVIEEIGEISRTNDITVKGKTYSIKEMLGKEHVIDQYIAGHYMVLYLSPSHYHRIHSPVTGEITDQWTLGRKSFPVNKWGLKYGKHPLSKNYRRITELKHEFGHLCVVKVGAMFVNSIEMVHEGDKIEQGQELAYFSFGSTVVLLFENNTFALEPSIKIPTDVYVGEKLGEIRECTQLEQKK